MTLKKRRRLRRAYLDNNQSNPFNRIHLTKNAYHFQKIVHELRTALHNVQLRAYQHIESRLDSEFIKRRSKMLHNKIFADNLIVVAVIAL